jgi:hypothetical protein
VVEQTGLSNLTDLGRNDPGCLPGSVKITLKMDAEPVIEACRNIPFQIAPQVKEELERMVSLEIIEPVKEPTEWVNAMHVVVKPNKLRICLDPRNLNQAIRREHFKLPTREEISAKFANCQVYSKLDASKGFWQMKLDEESSKLCTFITPWGRFKYKRLPFGISCAPEIYHRTIYNMFAHLKGVESSMDDICIGAKTQDEHDQLLRQVLDICKENGLTLNQEKCLTGVKELTFLGEIYSKDGIKPDPKKVSAIMKFPAPENKDELMKFLGMAKFLARFIQDLSARTFNLRSLLKNDVTSFGWMRINRSLMH